MDARPTPRRVVGAPAPRRACRAAPLVLAMAALVASGCTKDEFLHQSGIPGVFPEAQVEVLGQHGQWTDATVGVGGRTFRFFLPDNEGCRAVLQSTGRVGYANQGPLGLLRDDQGNDCEPVGLLSLRAWRDRRPRGVRRDIVPRGQANFQELFRNEEFIFLTGRFPMAGQIGWTGGEATIALVPNREDCVQIVERGVASMEFRQTGANVMSLVGRSGLCPVQGFVREPRIDPATAVGSGS